MYIYIHTYMRVRVNPDFSMLLTPTFLLLLTPTFLLLSPTFFPYAYGFSIRYGFPMAFYTDPASIPHGFCMRPWSICAEFLWNTYGIRMEHVWPPGIEPGSSA